MRGRVELAELGKSFDGVAVDGVDLVVNPGELVAIIGPSGCGKTTLLRLVAGLEPPSRGTIAIDGRDVTADPPMQRSAAMVFQSDTLFPDLCVRDNVAFGLRASKDARDRAEVVEVALLRLGISGLSSRFPDELSGGQRRRVALARALVLQPSVLLLDEPLSGLDGALRHQLAALIRENQRRFAMTTLYVTHDQDEALSIADRVLVMRSGGIEQIDTPSAVYTRPASVFVASFVGRANLLSCHVTARDDHGACVEVLGVSHRLACHADVACGQDCVALLRPEALRLAPMVEQPAWADVRGAVGRVAETFYYGSRTDLRVETEAGLLTVAVGSTADVPPVGSSVRVAIDPGQGFVLPSR